jgi:hypothetical protein
MRIALFQNRMHDKANLQVPTWRRVVAWLAVSMSSAVLVFWSVWGSIEAFYEGWYYHSLWMNIGLTIVQYLLPVLILMVAAVAGVLWPRFGSLLHVVLAAVVAAKFSTPSGRLWIALPLAGLGVLYWFGRLPRKRWALYCLCGLPIITLILSGALPAYCVSQRVDDGYRGERIIEGQGVRLRWASAGPGWPARGANWYQAQRACASLSSDGSSVGDKPTNTWRLPTAEELTRSLSFHGANAGGIWDSRGVPLYRLTPDKESPLWDPYSPVIYWWTATEVDRQRVYRFAYTGRAMATSKSTGPAYYGFRCVTAP